ncbi:MAG: hypothetical protein KF874_08000 [Rhizobiaceae bacterium]|nr:hypothetical protein [Rhizobiaceae bacterium]
MNYKSLTRAAILALAALGIAGCVGDPYYGGGYGGYYEGSGGYYDGYRNYDRYPRYRDRYYRDRYYDYREGQRIGRRGDRDYRPRPPAEGRKPVKPNPPRIQPGKAPSGYVYRESHAQRPGQPPVLYPTENYPR